MPSASLLQRFTDDELSRAPELVTRVRMGTAQLLNSSSEPGLSADERAHHAELSRALERQGILFETTFVASLRRRVEAEMSPEGLSGNATRAATRDVAGLELMDEARVEIDIEISRAMRLIDSTAEWQLHELQTFTSTLAGERHVTAESNPLRPLIYAMALWDAACAIASSQIQRAILLRTSSGVAAGLLKNAWAAASTRLEAQGVQPGIYRTVVLPSGAGIGRRAAASEAQTLFPDALLARLRRGPESRQRSGRPLSLTTGAAQAPTPDLTTSIFESLLQDSHLPDAFRELVSRLQLPAVLAATSEHAAVNSRAHPLWRLLDRIGELGAACGRVDDSRSRDILSLMQAPIEEIAASPSADSALLRHALNRLESRLAEELQGELRRAKPAIDALVIAERRDVLQQHVVQRLTEEMASVRASPVIRRFVTGTWARVIAADMLAHGEQSEAALADMKTVDDLLWTLRIPDHPQSRQRLVALLPGLLQRLRGGMDRVDLPVDEQQRVLGELMDIHTEALRPGGRGAAVASSRGVTPEEIVKRLREEVLPETSPRRSFSDSVIDLSSMETVPAEHMPTLGDDATDDPARRVEGMRVGERHRIFLQGRWRRVQLLWRSDRSLFYLFAGEEADRPHSITRRALERLAAAGLVQPLEPAPLVQRAIDRLLRESAAPA